VSLIRRRAEAAEREAVVTIVLDYRSSMTLLAAHSFASTTPRRRARVGGN
jgi:hypothetical protein